MLTVLQWFGLFGGVAFGLFLFWKFVYSLYDAYGAGVPTDVKYKAFGLKPPPHIRRVERK